MYKRIDRYIEQALKEFAHFISNEPWRGKERDCINLFVMRHLLANISDQSALIDAQQVRIECGVPQPTRYHRPSATKDIVIWKQPLDVAWDETWLPVKAPWVVMEWKTKRSGRLSDHFDRHDVEWLTAFTTENLNAFGYAVTVDLRPNSRCLHRAKFKGGEMSTRLNL